MAAAVLLLLVFLVLVVIPALGDVLDDIARERDAEARARREAEAAGEHIDRDPPSAA